MGDVFVLVAKGVYDRGIYGVFTDRDAAVAHAEALIDQSDYYHGFRVERLTVDEPKGAGRTLLPWKTDLEKRRQRHKRPSVHVEETDDE